MRRNRGFTSLVVALASALAVLAGGTGPAGAIDNADRPQERPSTWAPTHTEAWLTQNKAWGDVAYWMRWAGPSSTLNLGNRRDKHNSFEIGYKDLPATEGCKRFEAGGSAGFPNGMKIQRDYTEDAHDFVYTLFDGDALGADQRANPSKEYSLWGRCNHDGGRFETGGRPHFQVQAGHYNYHQDVSNTYADVTLNYIPAEQGAQGVPLTQTEIRQVLMVSPWVRNWSIESTEASWYGSGSTLYRDCAYSEQGRCQMQFKKASASNSWMYQDFKVRTIHSKDNYEHFARYRTGWNTGFQTETAFYCPPQHNTGDYCPVRLWLKTAADDTWRYMNIRVPRTNYWYYWMVDTWPAMHSDDDVSYWIEGFNRFLVVDTQWISGDL